MLYYCLKPINFLSYASMSIDEFRELSGSSSLEVDKRYFSIKEKIHGMKASSIEQDVFAYFVSIERNYSIDKPGVDFDTYIKDNLSRRNESFNPDSIDYLSSYFKGEVVFIKK